MADCRFCIDSSWSRKLREPRRGFGKRIVRVLRCKRFNKQLRNVYPCKEYAESREKINAHQRRMKNKIKRENKYDGRLIK